MTIVLTIPDERLEDFVRLAALHRIVDAVDGGATDEEEDEYNALFDELAYIVLPPIGHAIRSQRQMEQHALNRREEMQETQR